MTVLDRSHIYMEGQLKDALRELEMPDSYYEKATTAYESVSSDLTSESSCLHQYDPEIILQGSIKIGTAIKPITEDGSYDVDIVCNLSRLHKDEISQQALKRLVGREVRAYAERHSMSNEPHDGKRCWTLEYVDEANFHIDILSTVDDTYVRRMALALGGYDNPADAHYLAHTDKRHPRYAGICSDWPTTNPEGFAKWFLDMARYDEYRSRIAFEKAASVESIKVYAVKAPLQQYVQILKRHRDIYLDAHEDVLPIKSIIITTAAGKAYEKLADRSDWYGGFVAVVQALASQIEPVGESYRLVNPSDPLENFVEGWTHEEMDNFRRWQQSAFNDFAVSKKRGQFNKYARKEIRRSLGLSKGHGSYVASQVRSFVDKLPHHRHHGLTELDAVKVTVTGEKQRSGGVFKPFRSDEPLPKGIRLRFEAHAEDIKSYKVRWQVTNDGSEATRANCLRGGFYQGFFLSGGRIARNETTKYVGRHYVECLLEKDDVIYGRSEPFVVNIVGGSSAHAVW